MDEYIEAEYKERRLREMEEKKTFAMTLGEMPYAGSTRFEYEGKAWNLILPETDNFICKSDCGEDKVFTGYEEVQVFYGQRRGL